MVEGSVWVLVGMKNGGRYSTRVKLNRVGMKCGHGCIIPVHMGRK